MLPSPPDADGNLRGFACANAMNSATPCAADFPCGYAGGSPAGLRGEWPSPAPWAGNLPTREHGDQLRHRAENPGPFGSGGSDMALQKRAASANAAKLQAGQLRRSSSL